MNDDKINEVLEQHVLLKRMTVEVGMVIQIDPSLDGHFPACFMVVSEVKGTWGVMGYIEIPGEDGVAWYRCSHENYEVVGWATWTAEQEPE